MSLEKEIGETLEPIVRILTANLDTTLRGHLTQLYIQGDREMVEWGTTKGGIPIAYEGPPMEQAIKYAQTRGAQMVTGINEETQARLAQVVSEAIENKRGVDGLARDIRREFSDMTRHRSQMIARTESCDALEQAFMDRAKMMDIDGKEWVTFDPCPICEANSAEGIVPIDHVFSSGDVRPPAHPNCRCALAPARLPR